MNNEVFQGHTPAKGDVLKQFKGEYAEIDAIYFGEYPEGISIMFRVQFRDPLDGLVTDRTLIELVKLALKTRWFNNHHCNTHEELAQRVDTGLKHFFDAPQIVRSICGKT